MNKQYLIKEAVNVLSLRNGKIKYYTLFLGFALLFLSKPALATAYAHNASFYPACKCNYYVHATGDSYNGNLNEDGVSSITTDAVAVGCDTFTTAGTINKVATQGGWIDICEDDKQIPEKLSLHSVSIRAVFSNTDIIGGLAPEDFQEYDVAANFRLPWAWYSQSGWGGGIRLMSSAGALYGAGETALVVSLIPLVALGSQDGRFTLDLGAGGALLSRHRFGTQDFGGNFQFALTAGIGIPLFKRLGAGYRYLHYSDAAIYGSKNTGADFHMLELTYRF